jgi:predicted ATPase
MIKRLRLERFKNFQEAELQLGPLTVLVGTNASGKSNIRDAFRVLHGISRGYTVPEILGQKWIEGGVLQWEGIRGGPREAAFEGSPTFALETTVRIQIGSKQLDATYRIEIESRLDTQGPRVVRERLVYGKQAALIFDSHPHAHPPAQRDPIQLAVRVRKKKGARGIDPRCEFVSAKPVLSQVLDHEAGKSPRVRSVVGQVLHTLGSMQFLDLRPEQPRFPSFPGQVILGDRGENLASVLQAICQDAARKETLLEWLQELTPMDCKDFEFPSDPIGRIVLVLVEENGRKTSAYSASDGTLRFLAMLAALLGPERPRFYFVEEIDNGIHPARLHLLTELLERRVTRDAVQIVGTTHSPTLLGLLHQDSQEYVSLTYRLPGQPDARIRRILDIPEARTVLAKQDMARLHASGWMEHVVHFMDEGEPEE